MYMKALGLFEVKTRLSELCQEVADTGESVTVTRRGKPLVRIVPLATEELRIPSVWDLREQDEAAHGEWTEDFDIPPREVHAGTYADPLSED
jgi:prevent-host-death family protein